MLSLTLDTLRRLVGGAGRGTAPSSFFPLSRPAADQTPAPNLIYRLKAWPQLPEFGRTAEIYRMLSVMSSRPVNRQWILARSRMHPQQLDQLLLRLEDEGAVEVIDPTNFAASSI
jgi:hypothetical protein